MEKTYKLERKRASMFTVNCPFSKKIYRFNGSKKGFTDKKDIPEETYLWLLNSTTTFKDGELVISESDEEAIKEFEEQIFEEDLNEIKQNSHSREEIEELLNGNTNSMKAELKKITIAEEKQFVMQVAKDIKLDSKTKMDFLEEWVKSN